MNDDNWRCFHCGADLGVPKTPLKWSWSEGDERLPFPSLKTVKCPRCHHLTVIPD